MPASLKKKLHEEFNRKYKPEGKRALMQDFLSAWRKQLHTLEPSRQALQAILNLDSRQTCEYRIANGLCHLLLNCSYDEWSEFSKNAPDTSQDLLSCPTVGEGVVTQDCLSTTLVGCWEANQTLSAPADAPPDRDEKRHRGLFIPNPRCRMVWGRESFIQEVLNRLDDPAELSIFSLSGTPGYGKSEAASQIAKQALDRNLFADVLWVTARQSEWVDGYISQEKQFEALTWKKFLNEIAHQLDCPPERVHQRLRAEKLLVVLDNAETAQVEDILANLVKMLNPSRALITSRHRTKPPYVGLIEIPGLEARWSSKLLDDEAKYNNISVLRQASNEQLYQMHQLSRGAPLALHFLAGRVFHDQALEPILSELTLASRQVETFYRFCLEAAWQRIDVAAQSILRYMGGVDATISRAELSKVGKLLDSDLDAALADLRRWYLIEDVQDELGNPRYDLHPWVRSSVRGGLVEKWQSSLEDLEKI
ncbi:NB-ARC domain-containing protein [Coleofasciculus sp. H7-2]|uniref:NB-ARC domain-containing protein n=1 Tax=Coleofasciculus sp. H7-2 TaxID=3351545 RepID=UPI0036712CF2